MRLITAPLCRVVLLMTAMRAGPKTKLVGFARVLRQGFDREKGTAGQRLIRGLRLKIGPAIGLAASRHG